MGSVQAGSSRLAPVDALRGVAALGVFLFHAAGTAGFPKRNLPFTSFPNFLSLGASGVSLFFVISGFCLTLQQLKRGPQPFSVREYSRSRVARIVPAYWVVIPLALAVQWRVAPAAPAWMAWDTLLHVFFLHGFDQRTFLSLNGALWSMATEVQFYLAFPLLYAALRRSRPALWLTLCAVAVLSFRAACSWLPGMEITEGGITRGAFLSYQLPGRLLEFAGGMYLATKWHTGALSRRACAVATALLLPVALFCRGWGPPLLAEPFMGLVFTLLLGAALAPSNALQAEASPALRWAAKSGRPSYSFFLVHEPLLALVGWALPWSHPYARFLFLVGAGGIASLGVAFVLYRQVELRFWHRLTAAPASLLPSLGQA
jgi:peptidoglycan/LPS O-acetylase OafA/YrhL